MHMVSPGLSSSLQCGEDLEVHEQFLYILGE